MIMVTMTFTVEEPLPLRRGHRLRNFSEDSGEDERGFLGFRSEGFRPEGFRG